MHGYPVSTNEVLFWVALIIFLVVTPIIIFGFGLGIMATGFIYKGIIAILISIIWLSAVALIRHHYN